ncbi:MAG: DUF3169 family protein [Psychrobacillus sp.]
MKKVFTTIVSLSVGGVAGFTITLAIMMGKDQVQGAWYHPVNLILYIVLVIILTLLVIGLVFIGKIKTVNSQTFGGEQEDLMDEYKYKKVADLNIAANISIALSILGVAVSILMTNNTLLQIGFIFLFIASCLTLVYGINYVRLSYPERNIPRIQAKNYDQQLMDSMDDGEKYVTLQGLFKSHQLFNLFMLTGIILAVAFSYFSNQSQIFSIVLMCLVLLVVNTSYLVVVRNK